MVFVLSVLCGPDTRPIKTSTHATSTGLMKKITVVIADHCPIVREGLNALYSTQDDLEIVGEADNAENAVALCIRHRPDIIVMEMAMPGFTLRQFMQQTRKLKCHAPVLIVSHNREEQYAAASLRAGARGFVNKTRSLKEILTATRTVASGGLFLSADAAQQIALGSITVAADAQARRPLTGREQEILIELASGSTVTDIARRLHLSPKTVSTHKTRICQKLGIRSTFDLVRYTLDQGMV